MYDRKWSSGENRPKVSSYSVASSGTGLRSPSRGSTQMSNFRFGSDTVWYRRKRPSDDQLVGALPFEDASRTASSLAPVVDFSYRSYTPVRLERKMMRLPSGDQTGSADAVPDPNV